jgi:hypothetical protein
MKKEHLGEVHPTKVCPPLQNKLKIYEFLGICAKERSAPLRTLNQPPNNPSKCERMLIEVGCFTNRIK